MIMTHTGAVGHVSRGVRNVQVKISAAGPSCDSDDTAESRAVPQCRTVALVSRDLSAFCGRRYGLTVQIKVTRRAAPRLPMTH